ncbi:MAG TPA: RHS repeat-associated core domain-containing protein, partial [Blastocatellia bacterium]|nr:RHS repeat-associated core domain-containing protein [Blastocatellia bacterium]
YFYDGGQHRVKAVVNGVTTLYVYDAAGKLLAEYGTGSAGGSGTSYVTTDALGTPRIITGTDAANPVKGRHDYLPFGEEIQAGVGGRTAGQGYISEGLRQKYTAKERDQETGLDYFASRYYASAMGRFLSADSVAGQVGSPQTMNRYAYVLNNPLALVDPTGHAPGIVENPDYYDDEQEARRRKAQQSLPQMTLVFDEKAAAEVNAGNGTWASHGYSSVLNEQVIITADDTQIDPGLGSALTDFINNTVIDPHKNDGDRMVEGLFIGELELAIAGAGIGVLGPAAMAGEGIDIVPIPLTIDIAPAKPEEDPKLYGPFHRYVNSSELDKIMSSGLVGGREPRNYFGGGLGPSVKAWNGPLPDDGISPAIEFYTPIRPSSQSPGLVVWHAGTPGVIPIPGESGVVGIPASITKVRR